jgi:hypothetical protein
LRLLGEPVRPSLFGLRRGAFVRAVGEIYSEETPVTAFVLN